MKTKPLEQNQHCCAGMTRAVALDCDIHADAFDCPDSLIHYSPKRNRYGLIIHDGGSSFIVIGCCQWCGARPPEAKED